MSHDPKKLIHVFDERGRSLKSYEQLEAENQRLRDRLAQTQRILKIKLLQDEILTRGEKIEHSPLLH